MMQANVKQALEWGRILLTVSQVLASMAPLHKVPQVLISAVHHWAVIYRQHT